MPPVRAVVAVVLISSLSATAPALAAPAHQDAPSILMTEDLLMAGLANSRGDLYSRRMAQQSIVEGRNDRAIRLLKRAAYFADKPAQALMAEILWNGSHDQDRNRAEAYAWMDLAAERGYPELIAQREKYWTVLSDAEREKALAIGQSLYERYGDAVARPRLARQLRRQGSRITGSNTGSAGHMTILAMAPGGSAIRRAAASGDFEGDNISPVVAIAGDKFYAPQYWNPRLYFQQQDLSWKVGVTEQRMGKTEVGPMAPVKP